MYWDGTIPGESFYPGMEQIQGSHSVLGWKYSIGVLQSWDETTLGDSFCNGMERLQGSQSWWNDSTGVILSWDRTSPG